MFDLFIGNTNHLIDWDQVIKDCQKNFPHADKNTVSSVVERSEALTDDKLLGKYNNVIDTWVMAGYNLKNIVWYDYYPGQHFPIEVQTIFASIVDAYPLRVFVSEVWPGMIVPYHWDVEDKEDDWISQFGELHRYVCCIDVPRYGSVLAFDQHCLYFNRQGDIYKWRNYKDYHSTANAGSTPSYYFHFLGYKL